MADDARGQGDSDERAEAPAETPAPPAEPQSIPAEPAPPLPPEPVVEAPTPIPEPVVGDLIEPEVSSEPERSELVEGQQESAPNVAATTPPVEADPASPIEEVAPPPPASTSSAEVAVPPATTIFISPKQFLARALESLRIRKQKKLAKVVEYAKQKGSIKNDDVEKLLRVSDATATRYLSQLVKEGRLKRVGAQKQPRYEPV